MRLGLILTQRSLATQQIALAEEALSSVELEVFFYQDAAMLALNSIFEPRLNLIQRRWQGLNKSHGLTLSVCVASALARGVTDPANSQRHGLLSSDQPIDTLLPGFELCGLGALHEIAERCDRLVSL
jgi:tRNA 2-thiouridine synthesizing protein D